MAAQMDCDDARSQLKELERQRLALEDEAAAIVSELDGLGVGLKDALVDAEGYPRADLDLYRVRSQRGRHAAIHGEGGGVGGGDDSEEGLHVGTAHRLVNRERLRHAHTRADSRARVNTKASSCHDLWVGGLCRDAYGAHALERKE